MRALVQRVTEASVSVEATGYRAAIGAGMCVLLCAEVDDVDADAQWIAKKLANLRIFKDADDKMNRSMQDIGGSVLLVSQFTLAGNCSKGNRPSFVGAAAPAEGERLYELVGNLLRKDHCLPVETGVFGAMMQVSLVNDGPVTVMVER